MTQYVYNGPVMEFKTCVAYNWKGTTWAPSIEKARNNLTYQFKKANNKLPNAKISLPGIIKEVE